MGLVQEKRPCKSSTRIIFEKYSLKKKERKKFERKLFPLLQMKCLQKFGGCDYKDNTTIALNKLFSCKVNNKHERQREQNWHH